METNTRCSAECVHSIDSNKEVQHSSHIFSKAVLRLKTVAKLFTFDASKDYETRTKYPKIRRIRYMEDSDLADRNIIVKAALVSAVYDIVWNMPLWHRL